LQIKQHDEEARRSIRSTRLRENMKALKGSAEESFVATLRSRIEFARDRLAALRKGTEDVQAQRNQAQETSDKNHRRYRH